MVSPSPQPLNPYQPGPPAGRSNQQANLRVAVGTLIAAVLCVVVTVALWILPFVLSEGRDPNETGWVVLILYSVFPGGLAAVLFLISIIYFFVAMSSRPPR